MVGGKVQAPQRGDFKRGSRKIVTRERTKIATPTPPTTVARPECPFASRTAAGIINITRRKTAPMNICNCLKNTFSIPIEVV